VVQSLIYIVQHFKGESIMIFIGDNIGYVLHKKQKQPFQIHTKQTLHIWSDFI